MRPISKMVLRMYAPPVVIVTGGFAVAETVARTQSAIATLTPGRIASLSFLLAILLGTTWALYATWRLYRWARGRELRCACGGLMSRVRTDRQGEAYRKCLACGGKTAHAAH
ncbi:MULTISPECIES: hypothetical protein [unclassified Pseudoxanthomonas]|uniref:hypothetical protein n=1 Tax=unclassified Pseudoxanthomonas TaxID=2645906 RepID=UPI0030780A01